MNSGTKKAADLRGVCTMKERTPAERDGQRMLKKTSGTDPQTIYT